MKKIHKIENPEHILEERIERIQRSREWSRFVWELIVFLVLVYVTFFHILGFAVVQGNSMKPTLADGELVLFYRLDEQYHGGDVLIIQGENQVEHVKRVVATAGDTVDFDEEAGQLLINGEPLEEPYIYTPTYSAKERISYPLKVEAGQLFVLGDYRQESVDSRNFGCVQTSDVVGRVILHVGQVY